jgi:hypothetical protein
MLLILRVNKAADYDGVKIKIRIKSRN